MDKSIFKLLVAVSLSLHAEYIRDSDKQVVLDASSGLVWQDNTLDSTLHWTTAIKTCEALELGGYSDWRLSNYSELSQLADRSKSSTAVSSMFQNTPSGDYWSSSTYAPTSDTAWHVYFSYGSSNTYDKSYSGYIRCVIEDSRYDTGKYNRQNRYDRE